MNENNRKLRLGEIAKVSAGFSFRSAIKEDLKGEMFVAQAKDVRSGLLISEKGLKRIADFNCGDKLVSDGDVLFSARGFFEAVVIRSKEKIVASSSIYVLKPKIDMILPEYLAIFLNSKNGQAKIKRYQTGSTVKTILINDLRNISIFLSDIKRQESVVRLHENIWKQNQVLERKKQLNDNIISGILLTKTNE